MNITELLTEGVKLFLVLLALASLILVVTLVICFLVWYKSFEIERRKFVQSDLPQKTFRRLKCWFLLLTLLPLMRSEEYVVRRGWLTTLYGFLGERSLVHRLCKYYYLRCWRGLLRA
jgi:hypothetical protein